MQPRIGAKFAKVLTAKNAWKACGLEMGGQMGGMTNELGEFAPDCLYILADASVTWRNADLNFSIRIFGRNLSSEDYIQALTHPSATETPPSVGKLFCSARRD